jgi:beta-carotene 15,15'-dioxygenase
MARLQSQTNMLFAHRVAPVGIASVGWHPVLSGRLSFARSAHASASIVLLAAAAVGERLDTALVSMITCAAILLFGLPHGTFDLALIGKAHAERKTLSVVALYLGCAVFMLALWQLTPALALLVFLGLSIVHFAEDWADHLPPFFAHGISTALLTAPALMHRDKLGQLFSLLIGEGSSVLMAALAVSVAPVSLAIAAVAVIVLWCDGHRSRAVATSLALLTMITLPPLIGFALFFCLMHSPAQFASAREALGWQRPAQWAGVVVPLTSAALGIAALIFATLAAANVTAAMIVTAFVTLSILTLPHMAVPLILDRIAQRYIRKAV